MLNCPICNTKLNENNYSPKHYSQFNKKEYKLYHCLNCDVNFWWPLEMEKELYEESEEYKILSLPIDQHLESQHKIFLKYTSLKKGNLLDIGCGNGRFLEEVKNWVLMFLE